MDQGPLRQKPTLHNSGQNITGIVNNEQNYSTQNYLTNEIINKLYHIGLFQKKNIHPLLRRSISVPGGENEWNSIGVYKNLSKISEIP